MRKESVRRILAEDWVGPRGTRKVSKKLVSYGVLWKEGVTGLRGNGVTAMKTWPTNRERNPDSNIKPDSIMTQVITWPTFSAELQREEIIRRILYPASIFFHNGNHVHRSWNAKLQSPP